MFYFSILDYVEDRLIRRLQPWRWTTNQVWSCQRKIAVLQLPARWTYHAIHSEHLDITNTDKTFYYPTINVRDLVHYCIRNYDFLIQHWKYGGLVWVLKDVKKDFGHDPRVNKACTKLAILIRVRNFSIVTHIPVWEFGCARV